MVSVFACPTDDALRRPMSLARLARLAERAQRLHPGLEKRWNPWDARQYTGEAIMPSDSITMRSAALLVGLVLPAVLTAIGLPDPGPATEAIAQAAPSSVPDAPFSAWQRPDGPVRVALQAGHWKADEAPAEQAHLRTNGTRGGGKAEWEVNLAIARRTAAMLEEAGYVVEVLPTTIPPGYRADVFVAIHADGNSNTSLSGYRAAAPRRDRTGRADYLVQFLTNAYGAATSLPVYPTVTRRMRGYYAFNSRRYHHALDPMTVGVILETGFLTSPHDRRILLDAQDRAARGIADGVIRFVECTRIAQVAAARSADSDCERGAGPLGEPVGD